ncbi:Cell division protein DivIC [compost metagenome]
MQVKATNKPSKRSNKGSKRRLKFLTILLLCFMGWAGITIMDQFSKLDAKNTAVGELKRQLVDAQKVNEDTKREITRLHDREYIEQKIRKELNLSKPGETIFTHPK